MTPKYSEEFKQDVLAYRKLQRRNLELEQENQILKRAAAYFAKDALPKGSTLSA